MNILISAFRCEPLKGGEPGVGWNFSLSMAQRNKVWVLTRKVFQNQIEDFYQVNKNPGIEYVYYDLPDYLLKREKFIGEQLYYVIWQMYSIFNLKKLMPEAKIDLIHHITFNQYRTPSLGFFTKHPFVVGPIGGAEKIDQVFFSDLSLSGKAKELYRNIGADRILFAFLMQIRSKKKVIVYSSIRNKERLDRFCKSSDKSYVIPSIAINISDFLPHLSQKSENLEKPFTIVYSGTAKDWKGLHFMIRAISLAFKSEKAFQVKMIGIRSEDERLQVRKWLSDLGFSDRCELIDFLPRANVLSLLVQADLAVYPAFRDSGSMSVLECCAMGCPVLCLDAGGQDAFPDDIILKVPVSKKSYEDNLNRFSEKLFWAFENRSSLSVLGSEAQKFAFNQMTWDSKVDQFCDIYAELITP